MRLPFENPVHDIKQLIRNELRIINKLKLSLFIRFIIYREKIVNGQTFASYSLFRGIMLHYIYHDYLKFYEFNFRRTFRLSSTHHVPVLFVCMHDNLAITKFIYNHLNKQFTYNSRITFHNYYSKTDDLLAFSTFMYFNIYIKGKELYTAWWQSLEHNL